MEHIKPISVRPKFVGYWLLTLIIPMDLFNLLLLRALDFKVFLSASLLSIPATYFAARCLLTKERDLADLISLIEARVIYITCLSGSIILLMFSSLEHTVPGFLAAYLYSIREPFVIEISSWLSF
ncbi:hypothetical protein IQ22_03034 [Pseudomonas duriflava]|uniref:Uncharacterized protein n=1 Tax=Pseudomonas duriflava TaxID=459528 RepID=A0A562Q8V1_9PSED|nr:hypothetical protein IQ22_03034 [Pseudomonas duriflava]